MSGRISQDQTVAFKSTLFIPGIDMTLAPGQRNIKIQAGSIGSLSTTPQQFGAVGDGVTDSTAAFNAALAALAAAGGGKLYIPAGDYVINGTLGYTAGALLVQGDGKDTQLNFGSASADMFKFAEPDMTLADFKVVTPYPSSTGEVLFDFANANNAKLDRLYTDGGYHVVQFKGSPETLTYRMSITDCNFVNVMGNGVFYDQYLQGRRADREYRDAGSADDNGNGIVIDAGDAFNFSNINIQSFRFRVNVTSATGGTSTMWPTSSPLTCCVTAAARCSWAAGRLVFRRHHSGHLRLAHPSVRLLGWLHGP